MNLWKEVHVQLTSSILCADFIFLSTYGGVGILCNVFTETYFISK